MSPRWFEMGHRARRTSAPTQKLISLNNFLVTQAVIKNPLQSSSLCSDIFSPLLGPRGLLRQTGEGRWSQGMR